MGQSPEAPKPSLRQFVDALHALLKARGIPPDGTGLARALKAADQPVHRNTAQRWLDGTRRPWGSSVETLLTGLAATDQERALIRSSLMPPRGPAKVSLRNVYAQQGVNAGRGPEEIAWRYFVGTSSAGDRCEERRSTTVIAPGFQLAARRISITTRSLDMTDLGALRFEGQARRLGAVGTPLGVTVLPVDYEPETNALHVVVRFDEIVEAGDTVLWQINYGTPGLWDGLRATGRGGAGFSFRAEHILATEFEIYAPVAVFPALRLRPATRWPGDELRERTEEDNLVLSWRVPQPPRRLEVEILADQP